MRRYRPLTSMTMLLAVLASTSSCTALQRQFDASSSKGAGGAATANEQTEGKVASPIESVKRWFGLDAESEDLKRQFVALQYVSPVYPVGSYGIFNVRDVSVSCPKVELDGIYITTKAKMTIDASEVSWEKNSPAVTLGCRRGMQCIEINRASQQAVYWQMASLVTVSPATAQTLASHLENCIGTTKRTGS